MTRNFRSKVMEMGIVDTAKYRYVYKCFADHAEIRRIAINFLGTTSAIDGWEIVEVIK